MGTISVLMEKGKKMATCKNCLHIDACRQWYTNLPDKYHDGCELFKDRARFIELPCNVGDKVYRIDKGSYSSDWKPFVQELTVTEISWKKEKYSDKDLGFAIIADGIRYKFTSIGKSVFLTREEAEAKIDS